jgi:hypothetical protein
VPGEEQSGLKPGATDCCESGILVAWFDSRQENRFFIPAKPEILLSDSQFPLHYLQKALSLVKPSAGQ